MKKAIVLFLTMSMLAAVVPASLAADESVTEIYVSASAEGGGDGTKDKPFNTIEKARDAVRGINKDMKGDIIVNIMGGVYHPEETLRFSEEDSGTNGYYVKYKAYNNEKVTVTGGDKIDGWEKYNDAIWKASYSGADYMRQLWVDGKRARRAQSDKLEHISKIYDDASDNTYTADGCIVDGDRFASYKNQSDIQLHMGRGWQSWILNVESIEKTDDGKSLFMMEQPVFGAQAKGQHPLKDDLAVTVENAFEELDTPGEFYFDRQEKTVYYMPRSDESMETADVRAAKLEMLMEIRGTKSVSKVKNIEFNGISFENATWVRPAERGLRNGQAQTYTALPEDEKTNVPGGFVPACIQIEWAEKLSFVNNTVKDMGAVGIGLYQGVSYCNFEGNVFADIADSAITVGLPNQTYEDVKYEGYNLAADKPTTASGEAAAYPSSNITDVNNRTLWTQSGNVTPAWAQIDLLDAYRIDRIEIVGRQDMNQPTTRANFEIEASNDPEFGKYVVLARQGAEPFEDKATCVLYSNDEGEYRYIRIKKTDRQYFLLAEVRVINEDMEYSPVRESCKFNRIRNNYITRTGYVNYGAPAVQAYYVQNLDISHNEVYNVAYSGICVGWGWTTYPDSTVCRDNKVMYNRVHRSNLINFDGGAFYSLGQQPNSVVKGNYMSDQPNYITALYSDNGSKYFTVSENVAENVNSAYFINNGSAYLTYKNNYSPHNGAVMDKNHTSAEDPVRYVPGNPPMEAVKIMKNTGLEKEYRDLAKKAGDDLWPVSTELTFADIRYDGIDDIKLRDNYLRSFINCAAEWIKLAKVGDGLGEYKKEGYDEFCAFLEKAQVIAKKTDVDRDEVLKTRMEYEAAVENFKACRNTYPIDELIKMARAELEATSVGVKIGNVSQKDYDEFKSIIDEADSDRRDVTKLMLEREMIDFENKKINLNIFGFKIPNQLEDAVIDNENKTVDIKVRYTADASKTVPKEINTSDNINITPSKTDAVNLESGTVYTLSTKDGSASESYTVRVSRPDVITSDKPYSLKDAIADDMGWNTVSSTQKYYKSGLFGDIDLKFRANIEAISGDWPSIVFRNQSASEGFSSKDTSCYIIVLSEGKVEFHRYNNGVRTQFYGEVANVPQVLGPKLSSDAFKFGRYNDVTVSCRNTDEGVRIIFTVNGTEVFNVLDNLPGAITAPGYFGTISPKAQVNLSAD